MDESQFAHKGLYWFYASGSLKGIQPGHEAKLRRILSALDAAHEHGIWHCPASSSIVCRETWRAFGQ